MPLPMPLWPVWNSTGRLRFGEHLIERIGDAVVGEELLQRRVQLEAADPPGRDQPARFVAPPSGPRVGSTLMNGDHDVGVARRRIPGPRRWSRCGVPVSRSSTVKTTQASCANGSTRPARAAAPAPLSPKYLRAASSARRRLRRLEVDVGVDRSATRFDGHRICSLLCDG